MNTVKLQLIENLNARVISIHSLDQSKDAPQTVV